MGILDPRTLLIVGTLLMLLVGGLLGLMHRRLSPDVQPSARDWRIGTLLIAGGSLLLAFQGGLPPGFMLPVANGTVLLGLALYWRAVRRFHGRPDTAWLCLPVALAVAGIFWFAHVLPGFGTRVAVASLAAAALLLGATFDLTRQAGDDAPGSRRILAGLYLVSGLFFAFRGLHALLVPTLATSTLDGRHWLAAVAPMMILALPVVGTTAFLLMCPERVSAQWQRAAATDYLTGLPNRRTIAATGEQRFAAARRHGRGLAVAVIDIDHFKAINDHHGHDVGDKALRHIAAVLGAQCRGPQLAGRLGGEEFVALLEEVDSAAACAAAERIRAAVELAPLRLGAASLPMTASIGVGLQAPDDRDFDDMLRRADQALYVAKRSGRNRVELGRVNEPPQS